VSPLTVATDLPHGVQHDVNVRDDTAASRSPAVEGKVFFVTPEAGSVVGDLCWGDLNGMSVTTLRGHVERLTGIREPRLFLVRSCGSEEITLARNFSLQLMLRPGDKVVVHSSKTLKGWKCPIVEEENGNVAFVTENGKTLGHIGVFDLRGITIRTLKEFVRRLTSIEMPILLFYKGPLLWKLAHDDEFILGDFFQPEDAIVVHSFSSVALVRGVMDYFGPMQREQREGRPKPRLQQFV
jgi:hypothetical protein